MYRIQVLRAASRKHKGKPDRFDHDQSADDRSNSPQMGLPRTH